MRKQLGCAVDRHREVVLSSMEYGKHDKTVCTKATGYTYSHVENLGLSLQIKCFASRGTTTISRDSLLRYMLLASLPDL